MKEHEGLVVGAAGMMVAGILTANLSPLLAVSFADGLGFGIERAGVLVSCGQGGVALSVLLMVPLLPRLNRRLVGMTGAVIASMGLALTGFVTAFGTVLALQVLVGIGAGLAFASANSALAYSRLPERAFSIVTITWMLVGSALLTLGPTLHKLWPEAGVYLGIAAAELLCVVFIARLPDVHSLPKEALDAAESDDLAEQSPATPKWLAAGLLLIGAMWLMNMGNAIIWTFAQSIGVDAGLSQQSTATFLGVSQLIGIVGTGITLVFGRKINKMIIIVPAGIALGGGGFLVGTATTPAPFIIGFLGMFLGFYCLAPLLLALAAELDTNSGRFVVLLSAMTLAAGGIAPALGGSIAGPGEQWSRLGVFALVVVLAAIPMLVVPVRAARERLALTRRG